jgi:hypothetical protein
LIQGQESIFKLFATNWLQYAHHIIILYKQNAKIELKTCLERAQSADARNPQAQRIEDSRTNGYIAKTKKELRRSHDKLGFFAALRPTSKSQQNKHFPSLSAVLG